ncbi:MAG: VCBS repeat-containing protein, partial [Bdellovibrionota bacterium]
TCTIEIEFRHLYSNEKTLQGRLRDCFVQKCVTDLALQVLQGYASTRIKESGDLAFATVAFSEFCRDPKKCQAANLLLKAVMARDRESCLGLEEGEARARCEEFSILAEADRSRSPKLCSRILDLGIRNKCLVSAIDGTGEYALAECDRYSGEADSTNCKKRLMITDESQENKEVCKLRFNQSECFRAAAQNHFTREFKRKSIFGRLENLIDKFSRPVPPFQHNFKVATIERSLPIQFFQFEKSAGVTVTRSPNPRTNSKPAKRESNRFTAQSIETLGIANPLPRVEQRYENNLEISTNNPTIGSGDINDDGWIDIVVAEPDGISVYRNLGNLRFVKLVHLWPGDLRMTQAPDLVGLIDIDNDGWLDIYAAERGIGPSTLSFFLSDHGTFTPQNRVIAIPMGAQITSLAFADTGRTGKLDVMVGLWGRPNKLLLNDRTQFRESSEYQDLYSGRTWSALFSDVNGDGFPDLFIGNDYEDSDEIFFGGSNGTFRRIKRSDGVLGAVSFFNMGYDSGDLTNDLLLDVFSTDAEMEDTKKPKFCEDSFASAEFKDRCQKVESAKLATESGNLDLCVELSDPALGRSCALAVVSKTIRELGEPGLCESLPLEFKTTCR